VGLTISAVTIPALPEYRSEAGFEAMVLPEAERLYRLALAIVDDRADAEDVVQETLLSAWLRWPALRDYANQSAWLTRVCVNHSIRRRRQFRTRIRRLGDREMLPGQPEPSPFEGRLLDVHRAYQHLSPPQRAMVTLHLRDGFTVSECAVLIGCRPGTARSHLGRAMVKLRKEPGNA
jgi:RNA polymerase sigma-70 factor (ECF subfamily)